VALSPLPQQELFRTGFHIVPQVAATALPRLQKIEHLKSPTVLLVGIGNYAVGHLRALITFLIIGAAVIVVSLIVHHHWLGCGR